MGRKQTKQTISIEEFEFLYQFAYKEFKIKSNFLYDLKYKLHTKVSEQKRDKKQLREYCKLLNNNKTITGPLLYKIKQEIDELILKRLYRKSEIKDLEILLKKAKIEFVELHNMLYELKGEPVK